MTQIPETAYRKHLRTNIIPRVLRETDPMLLLTEDRLSACEAGIAEGAIAAVNMLMQAPMGQAAVVATAIIRQAHSLKSKARKQ